MNSKEKKKKKRKPGEKKNKVYPEICVEIVTNEFIVFTFDFCRLDVRSQSNPDARTTECTPQNAQAKKKSDWKKIRIVIRTAE